MNIKINDQFKVNYNKSQRKRNKSIEINGRSFDGRTIRNTFHLNSTDFQIVKEGNQIIFKTNGYGHGIGLSQYGVNYLAQEGKNLEQIIKYYYQGVQLKTLNDLDKYTELVSK